MKDTTLAYYDEHAESFVQNTEHADMHEAVDRFLSCLQPGASVLDFGCGSGRDSLYFLRKGYRVTALDGSSRLSRFAEKKTGIPVRCESFWISEMKTAMKESGHVLRFFMSHLLIFLLFFGALHLH